MICEYVSSSATSTSTAVIHATDFRQSENDRLPRSYCNHGRTLCVYTPPWISNLESSSGPSYDSSSRKTLPRLDWSLHVR
jgi:hypothetical protein